MVFRRDLPVACYITRKVVLWGGFIVCLKITKSKPYPGMPQLAGTGDYTAILVDEGVAIDRSDKSLMPTEINHVAVSAVACIVLLQSYTNLTKTKPIE
jgi:hypothetical protein